MQPSVAVVAQPSCLDALFGRVSAQVEPGATVAEMIERLLPQATGALRERLRVTIGEHVILPGLWHAVRPKAGAQVLIRAVPAGDIMRNVLTIAVTVAAIAAGQFYAPLLANSLVFGAGAVGSGALSGVLSAAITGTTLLAGTLLINALVPPRSDAQNKPSYAIQGLQNQLQPDGVIPLVLGAVRLTPPYAATPYTQAIGDERYVTAAFLCGYGPLQMTNWRIGDTPIERYADIVHEERSGYVGDPRLTLYAYQVIEEALSIELKTAIVPTGGPQIRTTASDCIAAILDITCPGGVFTVNKDGGYQVFSVSIDVSYAPSGTDDWVSAPAITIASNKAKAITRPYQLDFPTRGRYDIKLTRTTIDWDEADQAKKDLQRHGRTVWSVLRSIRPEYPIDFPHAPLALKAVRIRATGQLNGTIDALNCDAVSICPDYDAASSTWVARPTNNPASLFRWVLTGPAISYPFTTDEVTALEAWHAFCLAKGLTYNRVHDYEASVLDVLSDIAAAGRASPQDTGTAWTVVIDRALSVVSAHISPRNSWGYQGERPYTILPDAFRVSFRDETNGFAQAERIVPFPGATGPVTVTEKLDLPGVTDPDQVWKEARRRQYELQFRRDTHTVNQDWEALQCMRGDRVQLSHDVLDRMMVAARVQSVSSISGRTAVILDEAVTMVEGQTYAVRFRRDDGSSLLRTIRTVPGDSSTLILADAGTDPAPGNLALFGLASRETIACTVKGIEQMADFAARLTLIPHAPEIEDLVDAEVPPPWSGRAGADAQPNTGVPLTPIVSDVQSGRLAADQITPSNPVPIIILLRPNPYEAQVITSYQVRHRLIGGTAYTTTPSLAAAGAVVLSGYAKGQEIEFQARSVASNGNTSPWGVTVTHVVAATDPDAPSPPQNLSASSPSAGLLAATATSSQSASTVATQFYYAAGASTPFASATTLGGPLNSGPNTPLPTVSQNDLDAGVYRVWAVALDGNSPPIASVPVGPVNVTVS